MAHIQADRVKETTTTTGTGTVTLAGAATGFRTFASVCVNSDTCHYTIAGGAEWEVGLGTYSAGTLARTTVLASSNAGSLVNFSAGSKDVFITAPASRLFTLNNEQVAILPNASDPTTPAGDTLAWYAKKIAGRMVPKIKGPSGIDTPLQNAFWQNNIVMWNPTTATAGVWLGTAGTAAGTYSTGTPAAGGTTYQTLKRGRWANVATTANQILGQRSNESLWHRGNAMGQGGFFYYARFGFDVWTNGGRLFVGLSINSGPVANDPSSYNNTLGFCIDAADNGAISFFTRDTTATKSATGLTAASNVGFDCYIFAAPNGSSIGWRIVNINTGAESSGTATTTLPTATSMLAASVLASNAALTPVTSIQLGINRIYVETDY